MFLDNFLPTQDHRPTAGHQKPYKPVISKLYYTKKHNREIDDGRQYVCATEETAHCRTNQNVKSSSYIHPHLRTINKQVHKAFNFSP